MSTQTNWIIFGVGLLALIALTIWRKRHRRRRLIQKFGPEIAGAILDRRVHQGMTEEMVIEAWGRPADIDAQVFKTKTKHVWKYKPIGKNRFANRIYLEDGRVVGWKEQ